VCVIFIGKCRHWRRRNDHGAAGRRKRGKRKEPAKAEDVKVQTSASKRKRAKREMGDTPGGGQESTPEGKMTATQAHTGLLG